MEPDLQLVRSEKGDEGIFSELIKGSGWWWLCSVEHAYQQPDGSWQPKVPPGTYTCVLGDHVVAGQPIRTYEITGVPGHSGILFHKGNWQENSEGCVCLGRSIDALDGRKAVLDSRGAFSDFLTWADNRPSFTLEVKDGLA